MNLNKYQTELLGHEWLEGTIISVSIGKSEALASVSKQWQISLSHFLFSQIGKPREGNLTSGEYAVASEAARKADKGVFNWYSLAKYLNRHRSGANWQGSNVVVLDADAKYGKDEGPQYAFSAAQLRDRFAGLNFVAMPTYSYTDETPRWRILIPLSESITQRDEFRAVAIELADKLDGCVDPRSYTPEQLWFGMSSPRGEWAKRVGLVTVGG